MSLKVKKPYYLGIDAGVASVGWAVTDSEYRIPKCKGQDMWGVRLFPEAQTAVEQRAQRTARRRLTHRRQRLDILEMLFAPALNEIDPQFLMRMHESAMWSEDKSGSSQYSVFADADFTDADYYKQYPTVYHLRSELAHSTAPHDVRLVFLALHHMMKSRGHFLYDMADLSGHNISLKEKFAVFCEYLLDTYGLDFKPININDYLNALQDSQLHITQKAEKLNQNCAKPGKNAEGLSIFYINELLAGKTVKLDSLFGDAALKESKKSVCLREDLEEKYDEFCEILDDHAEVLTAAKEVYDAARLAQILGNHEYLCDAKIEIYEQNKKDLRILKEYVRREYPGEYKRIFCKSGDAKGKLHNYSAYSRYHHASGEHICTQAEFCDFLKKTLPDMQNSTDAAIIEMYQKICDSTFLPRLRSSDNGVIPYQIQLWELQAILSNVSEYLPFLLKVDEDGFTPAEKIIKTFEFRVPYYVGPLGKNAGHHWAVMKDLKNQGKIFPWNFEQRVDLERSAQAFMVNLIGRCTYTGEPVLPKDSLLYSEYMLLNELNPLKINGEPVPIDVKKRLIEDLFLYPQQKGKVTKKKIFDYLLAKGWASKTDVISGVDNNIKTKLRSHHDFAEILNRTHNNKLVEDIIKAILVFGDDKKMLRRWLRKHVANLTEREITKICRLKYTDWGNLSQEFLTEIYTPGQYGEARNIMDMLRDTNDNLMQLLSDKYEFMEQAEKYRDEKFGNYQTLEEKLDDMYLSPAVRRSIRQTLRIVNEIVKLRGAPPKKIFIEMARDGQNNQKGKRTESRKNKLQELYKACEKDVAMLTSLGLNKIEFKSLKQQLDNEEESNLRSIRLYLYYTQFGKCMYSGESMDLSAVLSGKLYDRDHIFPRSKIKDDSMDNLVLVKNELNREKLDTYPIHENIRAKMAPFWKLLKDKGMISEKKYARLIRHNEFTPDELSSFVARQLVQTQQSTKALTILLKELYGNQTRIVFSKASNVSEFRQEFKIIKCREVNDLHHAKDAYLNVVVGNVYDTRFTTKFFQNIQKNEKYSIKTEVLFKKLNTENAWDINKSIAIVKKYVYKNTPVVTHMSYQKKGQLFDSQPKPAGKGKIPRKEGMPIAKYGGYNSQNIAYFFIAECKKKKKYVRSFYPVLLYKKGLYETNPLQYCEEILHLEEPKIIYNKILVNSLVELDHKRVLLTGYSAEKKILEMRLTHQLFCGPMQERYIKNLCKYIERCKNANSGRKPKELPITAFDGITCEQNLLIYNWFTQKSNQTIYPVFMKTLHMHLKSGKTTFSQMSIYEQCDMLVKILQAFQCNAKHPNLKPIGGSSEETRYRPTPSLEKLTSAYLIHQSVTGLYENKVDLLK